jgi:hypothetical protein
MRVHRRLVFVLALLIASASEASPPEPDVDNTHPIDIAATTRVPVQVYTPTGADLSDDDRLIALDVAREVLSSASVDVVWTLCGPGACLTPAPEVLKVRFVRSPDGGTATRDSRHLGHSWINPEARTGVLATVFIDRTRRLAGTLRIDHRVLLGRTIAHELGHLLLATTAHGAGGLMRESWSFEELSGTRRDHWVFDPLDAAAIRERLLVRSRSVRPHGAS